MTVDVGAATAERTDVARPQPARQLRRRVEDASTGAKAGWTLVAWIRTLSLGAVG
jgi:hypothetical protein